MHYAVVFLVFALVAAFFGFGGLAVALAPLARALCYAFVLAAAVALALDLARRR